MHWHMHNAQELSIGKMSKGKLSIEGTCPSRCPCMRQTLCSSNAISLPANMPGPVASRRIRWLLYGREVGSPSENLLLGIRDTIDLRNIDRKSKASLLLWRMIRLLRCSLPRVQSSGWVHSSSSSSGVLPVSCKLWLHINARIKQTLIPRGLKLCS